MVTWALQKDSPYFKQWKEAISSVGGKILEIELSNFPQEPIQNIVALGTTSLVKSCPRNWYPGVFFNHEHFKCTRWQKEYGSLFLNNEGYVTPVKTISLEGVASCFIRPNADLKTFSGSLVNAAGLAKFKKEVENGEWHFKDDTEVFIAPH